MDFRRRLASSNRGALAAALLGLAALPAMAQGIPVFDASNMAQAIKEVEQGLEQINQLKVQLTEAKRLYDSVNTIRNVDSLADVLNNQGLREFLPPEYDKLSDLVNGTINDYGQLSSSAQSFRSANRIWSGASSPGNDFYAQEIERRGDQIASNMAIGEQIYQTAAQRIEGLEGLRLRISQVQDGAELQQLQARIQAESAMANNDLMRLQGLNMLQQAQQAMNEQRETERRRQASEQSLQWLQSNTQSSTGEGQ